MQSRFEQVIVIGYGKIAGDVLRFVAERQAAFGYRSECIEYECHGISKLRSLCEAVGAGYARLPDKKAVLGSLLAIEQPALIVSAGNNYLFPPAVVSKKNLEIINFHSALLPKLPGRNAPSWAIYLGETVSGATWHYVTESVDSGAIIAQLETPVTDDIKAYELARNIMVKAFEAFQGFYEELLIRHIAGRPQPKQEGVRRVYYSWELPGDGVCSIHDPSEKIYRILRAMDYGKNDIFPPVRIRLTDGNEMRVSRYIKKTSACLPGDEVRQDLENDRIYFPLDGECELMICYKKEEQSMPEKLPINGYGGGLTQLFKGGRVSPARDRTAALPAVLDGREAA